MKKHPGIWFTLWTLETLFLLSFLFEMHGISRTIRSPILFFWWAMCVYWITVYHVRWLESKLEKK
jgi:hypothetical protein